MLMRKWKGREGTFKKCDCQKASVSNITSGTKTTYIRRLHKMQQGFEFPIGHDVIAGGVTISSLLIVDPMNFSRSFQMLMLSNTEHLVLKRRC
jgi:hypothetical protein